MWKFVRIAPNRLLLPRLGISSFSSGHRFRSPQERNLILRLTVILKNNHDWLRIFESSDIPKILNQDVVRAVISHFCASKPRLLIDFFVWSQTKVGKLKDLDLFSFLLVSLYDSGSLTYARSVFEMMVRTWKSPLVVFGSVVRCFREEPYSGSKNPMVLEMMMNGYRKLGLCVEAGDAFLSLRSVEEFRPGLLSCNLLLGDLLKANELEKLLEVYDRMSEMNIDLDVYAYTSIVSAHFKRANFDSAKRVFSEMGEKDLVSYKLMIDGFCNAGLVDEAAEVKSLMIEKGFSLDKYTYKSLIMGCFKRNRLKEAFEIKEEMVARGVPVDLHDYRTLLYKVCKAGNDMSKAREIVDEMIGMGFAPDLKDYTLMIEGYCRISNLVKAIATFGEMKRVNLKPSVVTYGVLVKGHCNAGDFKRAENLIKEMASCGVKPDCTIYNTVIFAYLKEGKPEEAKRTLKTMTGEGITPDETTYNSLIAGFCMIQDFESARAYFDEMSARKIKPGDRAYRAFVHGYVKAGNMEMADKYLEEMIACRCISDESIYKASILRHCKDENLERAFSDFNHLLACGTITEAESYAVLINCLSSSGKIEEALRVLSELQEKKGLVADIYHYNPILVGLCKRGDLDGAFRLRDDMLLKGVNPDIVTYNALIRGSCFAGEVEKAEDLFCGVSEKRLTPNRETYTRLIEGCCKSGYKDRELELRDEMAQKGFV